MWKLTETRGFKDLSEIAAKTTTNDVRDSFAGAIKEQLERGYFDMWEPDVLNAYRSLGSEGENLLANVKNIPFREFFDHKHGKIKEFLASSGTTGIAGAYYLIPVKLYAELQTCAQQKDVVAQISKALLTPEAVSPGTTTKVDIVKDGQMEVGDWAPGSISPTTTIETVQCTLDFSHVYGCNIRITNDLIEDSQFELMNLHVEEAGKAIGEKASDLAAYQLSGQQYDTNIATNADYITDGDGTMNGGLSGTADTTKFDGDTFDLETCYRQILESQFTPTTILCVPHAMVHSIITTVYMAGVSSEPFLYERIMNGLPPRLLGCDIVYATLLHLLSQDAAATVSPSEGVATCIFDKNNALLSGRKRWMRVEHYAEPVKDLVGATVSFRQDSVNIYADSSATIVETD